MPDTVSKCRPFSLSFNLGNNVKSQGAKSGKQGEWGMIDMLLLITNSDHLSRVGEKLHDNAGHV
jgi:hypothetical protein